MCDAAQKVNARCGKKDSGAVDTPINSLLKTKGHKTKITLAIMLVGASLGFAIPTLAATPDAKAAYSNAKDKAASDYKAAAAQCDAITGNPKDICIAQAKAARVQVESEAKAQYEGTVAARVSARKDIADANYNVAKAKCASQNGNAKDVCNKEAKAAMVAAKADATADKKVVDARADARDDKMTADYKVALEKCDALAGPGKDACVAAAKSQYGK